MEEDIYEEPIGNGDGGDGDAGGDGDDDPEPSFGGSRRASRPSITRSPSADNVLHRILDRLVERDSHTSRYPVSIVQGPEAAALEKFDGVDAQKLRTFLTSCRIVFDIHKETFPTDRSRILYAGSYLTGIAADWYRPFVETDEPEHNEPPQSLG